MRSRASRTITSKPRARSSLAAASPASPAPTTATFPALKPPRRLPSAAWCARSRSGRASPAQERRLGGDREAARDLAARQDAGRHQQLDLAAQIGAEDVRRVGVDRELDVVLEERAQDEAQLVEPAHRARAQVRRRAD